MAMATGSRVDDEAELRTLKSMIAQLTGQTLSDSDPTSSKDERIPPAPTACCGYVNSLGYQTPDHEFCCFCGDSGFVLRERRDGGHYLAQCPKCQERQATPTERSWSLARLPREYWTRGIPGIREAGARRIAEEYVAKWPPQRALMLLYGAVGSGKSSMAAAILREVDSRHGYLGRWYSVPDLLARYRATMEQDARETATQIASELNLAPLVVLDDLGTENGTGWAYEQVYLAIDRRYGALKPLIVTSNVPPEQMEPRIASRLQHKEYSTVVRFGAADRRIAP